MQSEERWNQSKVPGKGRLGSLISLPTRFRIIGIETSLVGTFLVLTFTARSLDLAQLLPSVDADLPIVGGALLLVGLEIMALARRLPPTEKKRSMVESQ